MKNQKENVTLKEKVQNPDCDNLRTEYSVLSLYHNQVVTFRFTTLGFFIATVGLIAGSTPSKKKAILLIGLSISL